MIRIDRILCPVDFSDVSRHALAHAAAFAQWYGSNVTVLHVYSAPVPPVAVSQYPGNVPMLAPIQPDEVREQVRQFCKPLDAAGVSPAIVVEEGDPAKVITRMAGDAAPDLLIMGTHGRGGFQRLLLGSVTEKVLRLVACPLLTVPPPAATGSTPSFKTILCPIDFGPSALRALEHAFSLAKEADARVVLLHVVESLADVVASGEPIGFSIPDFHQSLERDAAERLSALIPADARSWCRPEVLVTSGKAHREIVRVAKENQAELVVMGVQGRGAIDLLLFGSTTHHVIREAGVPVLTLRAAGQ
jgi:nucleotide-binding universal stress UspA family protein